MDLSTIYFGSFALLFLLYRLVWKRRTSAKIRSAPEPAGAWLVIGHLTMLLGPNLPHIALGNLADKYGPVFTLRIGLKKALVVSSWEVAKECFTTYDKVLATRPNSVAVEIMGYNYAVFGLGPYGSYWREARKIAILELLSSHRLELLKHIRVSEVNTSMNELYKIWQAKRNKLDESALVEMNRWFDDLTLNVIVKMVAGKRYFGSSIESDDGEGKRLQKAVKEFFHFTGKFLVSDSFPFLGWLDFHDHKVMRRRAQELDSIMERWLVEHQRNMSAGGTETEQDFMYVMLSILEGNIFYGYDAGIAIKAMCFNMILGGADTTTATLTWVVCLLLNNRHTLRKAQDEMDAVVGKNRLVEESDIEKLVYLQAIVKETLRLYPVVALSGPHEAMEDCTIAGYHVAVGTRLTTNIWKIQRDPRVWSDPCEFQPERFLTAQANVDVRGQPFKLIPFGYGRRSCPGFQLGLLVVNLVLGRLLQGFNLESPMNESVDMTEYAGATIHKATPLHVIITPRLPSDMY